MYRKKVDGREPPSLGGAFPSCVNLSEMLASLHSRTQEALPAAFYLEEAGPCPTPAPGPGGAPEGGEELTEKLLLKERPRLLSS